MNYPTGKGIFIWDIIPCGKGEPTYHREFSWESFLTRCDFHAPQVYWEGAHNPAYQLDRSIQELAARRALPVIPIGSRYSAGSWSPTVEDMDQFNTREQSLSLPTIAWWSWQHAEEVPKWWEAISVHAWTSPNVGVGSPKPNQPALTLDQRVSRLEDLASMLAGQSNPIYRITCTSQLDLYMTDIRLE